MRPVSWNAVLSIAALVLLSGLAAGDDFKIIRLEQDMRNLEREVQTLSRQLAELRQYVARSGEDAALSGRKPPPPPTDESPGWLSIANWDRLRPGDDELKVIDDQHGAPTSARLIAEVTARAIRQIANDRPIPSGLYHLAAAGETTWNGYARFAIAEATARGVPLKVTPDKVLAVPSSAFPTPARRPLNSRLSTLKLRDALGIELPDWTTDAMGTLDTILPEKTT